MYRTIEWITEKRFRILLFLCFFLLTGCGRLADYIPGRDPSGGRELQLRLDEGNRLFMAGDYSAAEAVFQNLRETGSQDVIRPALYGLACSRFMLAESRQDYLDAINILELWQRISPVSLKSEDPRMLLVLLSASLPGNLEGEAASDSEESFLTWLHRYQERNGDLETQITHLQNEMAEYEGQKTSMEEMEAANSALKEKLKVKEEALRTMSEELSKIREQISTLETIDQEIQKKKQGISPK